MVRLSTTTEQAAVEALSQTDRATKDFKYLWTRWGNWNTHPPIVALRPQEVLGFHAATFSARTSYVNSYYQLVDEKWRGKGVGAQMVGFLLRYAAFVGCTRLKFKVPETGDGRMFWEGFGLRPFGTDGKHLLFDVNIRGVLDVSTLVEQASKISKVDNIPVSVWEQYRRRGIKFLGV